LPQQQGGLIWVLHQWQAWSKTNRQQQYFPRWLLLLVEVVVGYPHCTLALCKGKGLLGC
jgi:hypothetical protein